MVWTLSALSRLWPWTTAPSNDEFSRLSNWARPAGAAAFVLTLFVAMHVVPTADPYEARNWKLRPSPDVYSYIAGIEREFEGLPPERVLLDVGNWIYLRHSILARDRAISLADQPCNDIYDNFDVMISRIRNKEYDKILVHDLGSPFFIYDYALWRRPSGVRKALLENYTEVRVIPLSSSPGTLAPLIMFTGPVSVLVPKSEAVSNENNTSGEKKY
jgi:hypothetical protein